MRGGIWYKIYDEQTPQWFRFKTEIEASLYEIFLKYRPLEKGYNKSLEFEKENYLK